MSIGNRRLQKELMGMKSEGTPVGESSPYNERAQWHDGRVEYLRD